MTDKRCPDCKFAIRAAAQLNGPMQCRRNPPSVFMIPIGHGQISMNTTFPQVDATTWCGEFAASPALPNWKEILAATDHLVGDVDRITTPEQP